MRKHMPEKGIRSTYSQSPFQILMYDDQGLISSGSGFFYEYLDENYLITNWHNISGKHFLTKDPIGNNRRFPTYIKAKISSWVLSDGFTTIGQRIEIYSNYQPLWFEHPIFGSECDVIAIPLEKPRSCPEFMHNAVNRISNIKIPVKPGCTAFVIGFPNAISSGFGLPIWKSGYIASEPYYDVSIGGEISEISGLKNGKELPAFFIDTQTRQGMSGAPVFASYTGNWNSSQPYEDVDPSAPGFWERDDILLGENRLQFVGCYSGRVGKQEDGAALGICWREDVIQEICGKKILGKHPHISA